MALIAPQASKAETIAKPFKVCPEIVKAKDTPCRVLGPTAAIVHRIEIPDNKEQQIKQLEEENKMLRKMLEELANEKSSK